MVYIPTNTVGGFLFFHIPSSLIICIFFFDDGHSEVLPHCIIYLIISDVKLLFMWPHFF